MHIDPLMPMLAAVGLAAVAFGLLLRRLHLPVIIGYLLSGILLGPHVLAVVPDTSELDRFGGIGVALLLFFVGMEMRPDRMVAHWKIALVGTAVQILVSVVCVLLLGALLAWPLNRSVLLGFVISISSTAVVLRLLQRGNEASTRLGEHVTSILLSQDIAIVPMLIIVGAMGGTAPTATTFLKQGVGVLVIGGIVFFLVRRSRITLGLGRLIGDDRELQVFAALILAFGLAVVTGFLELSTALGAFVGGMLVSAARETHWVHTALEPFRILFLALFFVSIGMLLDVAFLRAHVGLVLTLTALVLGTNTLINAGILRLWHHSWRTSIYGGALLAQIGELSYVLIAIGKQARMVSDFAYQATVSTITLSLIVSPFWILAGAKLRLTAADGTGDK